MQLSIVDRILSLVKGKYLPQEDRKEYSLIITETYSTPVSVIAKDMESAKKVARGLYDLGLINKDSDNCCITIEGAPTKVLKNLIKNSFSRF